VLGGPCAWVARRYPPPPARRSPPPHLALGTSASLRHLHSSSCAQCMRTGGPCTWVARQCPPPPARRSLAPSSLSTTSRAPRGQLLLLAVPSSCSSLPSAVPRAATDRADHAASVPPAALRTQSTRRADEPLGSWHVQTARRRGPPADHASSSQSDGSGAPHFARDARDSAARWRSDRRGGGQGKGRRGRRRRSRTTPHIRHRSRAPRKHPIPHICPTHLAAHSPLLAAVFHEQYDYSMPLHLAARNSSSVAVVQALLAAYPEAASATNHVRRPSPLAAWMRGPERSSEVIICNQGQSGVIIRNQRALRGQSAALRATRWPLGGHSVYAAPPPCRVDERP
jgi:hypothetical protein